MKKSIIFLSLFFIACVSFPSINQTPIKANKHELYFGVLESGNIYRYGTGIMNAVINSGELKRVRVIVPQGATGRLLVSDNGDQYLNLPVEGQSQIEVDLGFMKIDRFSGVVGFALVTRNYGTMTGRLYYVGNLKVTSAVDVDFTCPVASNNGPLATCARPATFPFHLSVNHDDITGKMQILVAGKCTTSTTQAHDIVTGEKSTNFAVTPTSSGYCNIRIDTRQDWSGTDWKLKRFKSIDVNFYDPDYIPLGSSPVSGTSGDWRIVVKDNYDAHVINDVHGGSLSEQDVVESKTEHVEFVAWDKFGRTTRSTK